MKFSLLNTCHNILLMTEFYSLKDIEKSRNIMFDDIHYIYEQQILDIFNGKELDFTKYHDNGIMLNVIAMNYRYKQNTINTIKYYLMAIDKNNVYAMRNLAKYCYTIQDYDNMVLYYSMAAEKGDNNSIYSLATYYKSINNTSNMIKYYELAVETNNDTNAINELYKYFENKKEYANMKKYLILNIIYNNYVCTIKNKVMLFDVYLELNKNSDLLSELYYDHDVLKYIFKYSHNTIQGNCVTCTENDKVISKCCRCKFMMCSSCYVNVNKCPSCRTNIGHITTPFGYTDVILTKIEI